jgi:hypothetical protein
MVDEKSQPYFNVFWTDPAEAAHDWPDFGDVRSRQLQAAVMGRHMTGKELPIERMWLDQLLSMLDKDSGLLVRPKTNYSEAVADLGDQALTLYALVTVYIDGNDDRIRRVIVKMPQRHAHRLHYQKSYGMCPFFGLRTGAKVGRETRAENLR